MEFIIFMAVLVVLDILAVRFGVDSRELQIKARGDFDVVRAQI